MTFPLLNYEWDVPEPPHPGSFGVKRKHHRHEGIDLYAPIDSSVIAIEPGIVVAVLPFTGPSADSPWWRDTEYVMVEGSSGVINYGEISPLVKPGQEITEGQVIGAVLQVLRQDKGLPLSMLHLELYVVGTREPIEWKLDEPQPKQLLDPRGLL